MSTNKSRDAEETKDVCPPAEENAVPVDAMLQDALGRRLREVYQEVINEDVPAKLMDLLIELKKKESGGEPQP